MIANMSTHYLHHLNSKNLLIILRHVQLGHDYLSKRLSKNDYTNLLSVGCLSNNQVSKINSDKQEKLGNTSVVVNTILTSCFGAWLGFSAFNQSSIISPFGFFIVLIAISLGILTGYLSYILTHRQASLAFRHQQLSNVQRVIIDIIINKRQKKIKRLCNKIYSMLNSFESLNVNINEKSEKRLLEALTKIEFETSEEGIYKIINKSLRQIKSSIHKLNPAPSPQELTKEMSFNSADFMLNNALTNATYIKILTKSDLPNKYHIPKIDRWLRGNIVGICVGLLPTFLGSFASMFVFLNGFPSFLEQFNFHFGFNSSQLLILKSCMLIAALNVSLYFAYSHIHSNYKAFKRVKQLELSDNIIAEKTNTMIQLISQLNHWSKIVAHLQIICDVRYLLDDKLFQSTTSMCSDIGRR